MARNAIALRILIASPSDVERERDVVADVIGRWNAVHSTSTGILLEPIRWETHAHPAAGDYPQGIINQQIVDDSDIVVGVFWSRLGTPTPRAISGTVEEIERLRPRGKRVMLYFSRANLPIDHDREQFQKLQDYRKSLAADTLCWEYNSTEDLEKKFTDHLATVVNEIATGLNARPRQASPTANLVALKPLSELRSIRPDESDVWNDEFEGWPAAVAIFRNDAIKGVNLGRIDDLSAQITYYAATGGEVQRIYCGCWLGAELNSIRLGVGETRELIIAVTLPIERTISIVAIEDPRQEYIRKFRETSFKPLDQMLYDVNVRLVGRAKSEGDVVEDFHFNLGLENDVLRLGLGWTDSTRKS